MVRSQEEIVSAVQKAGIVGAGGAGFPTHFKLKAKVDTVIANGSECEPMLATDKTLMKLKADRLIEGMKIAMQATGASLGVIGIKAYYEDVVDAVKKVLPADGSIRLHPLENYYPAGDEFLLVYDVTGRVIPEGGLPLHVGVVVSNVLSLVQISEAVEGKVVTERILTVGGEVRNPQVMTVPVGATYRDVIELAGGPLSDEVIWIDGGPMMGSLIHDLDDGVAKTTSGILGLQPESLVVRQKKISVQQMIKLSKSACCQCMRCTDLCPRTLLGHEIFPHMTMRTIDYNLAEPTKHVTSAFLCSQCGVCELVACDFMWLSPKKIFAAYKEELIRKGVKNPHTRSGFEVNSQYENRKVSLQMVNKKLGLTNYSNDLPYGGKKSVKRVRIPITKHIGAPAVAQVQAGKKVHIGELIAATSDEKLGACYHASISGEVSEINDKYIEITG